MFLRVLIIIAGILMLASPGAHGYEFSPIVAQFEATGSGSARNFTVRNTQPGPVALQIEVFTRNADDTGAETREPDYDSFVITPPQLVLAPGSSRSIRVQWVGEPVLDRERAFRLVVSQLPINFDEDADEADVSASVAIGYTYEVAVYVSPPRTSASVELVKAEPAVDAEGKQILRLTLRNSGTKRAILNHVRLSVSNEAGQTTTLDGDKVANLNMKNILSGTQFVVALPWPEDLAFGPVSVRFNTEYLVMN